ncbi:MAG: hypothetical protein V1816_18345 [Pseudomonadota bacterium]
MKEEITKSIKPHISVAHHYQNPMTALRNSMILLRFIITCSVLSCCLLFFGCDGGGGGGGGGGGIPFFPTIPNSNKVCIENNSSLNINTPYGDVVKLNDEKQNVTINSGQTHCFENLPDGTYKLYVLIWYQGNIALKTTKTYQLAGGQTGTLAIY